MKLKLLITLILVLAFCLTSCVSKKKVAKGGCYYFAIEQEQCRGS